MVKIKGSKLSDFKRLVDIYHSNANTNTFRKMLTRTPVKEANINPSKVKKVSFTI